MDVERNYRRIINPIINQVLCTNNYFPRLIVFIIVLDKHEMLQICPLHVCYYTEFFPHDLGMMCFIEVEL